MRHILVSWEGLKLWSICKGSFSSEMSRLNIAPFSSLLYHAPSLAWVITIPRPPNTQKSWFRSKKHEENILKILVLKKKKVQIGSSCICFLGPSRNKVTNVHWFALRDTDLNHQHLVSLLFWEIHASWQGLFKATKFWLQKALAPVWDMAQLLTCRSLMRNMVATSLLSSDQQQVGTNVMADGKSRVIH